MKYRRTPDGYFLLYSVGWDERDDGGAFPSPTEGPPRTAAPLWIWKVDDEERGDWVWRYPEIP